MNEDVGTIDDIAGTRPLDDQRELRWEEGFRHEELDGEDSEDNSADALRRLHRIDEPSSIITASEAASVQAQQDHELDGLTLLMNRVAVTETQRPSESPLHVNDTYAWEEDASNSSVVHLTDASNRDTESRNAESEEDIPPLRQDDDLPYPERYSPSSDLYEASADGEQNNQQPAQASSGRPTVEQSTAPVNERREDEIAHGSLNEEDDTTDESEEGISSEENKEDNDEITDMDNRVIDLLQDAWDPFCRCGQFIASYPTIYTDV